MKVILILFLFFLFFNSSAQTCSNNFSKLCFLNTQTVDKNTGNSIREIRIGEGTVFSWNTPRDVYIPTNRKGWAIGMAVAQTMFNNLMGFEAISINEYFATALQETNCGCVGGITPPAWVTASYPVDPTVYCFDYTHGVAVGYFQEEYGTGWIELQSDIPCFIPTINFDTLIVGDKFEVQALAKVYQDFNNVIYWQNKCFNPIGFMKSAKDPYAAEKILSTGYNSGMLTWAIQTTLTTNRATALAATDIYSSLGSPQYCEQISRVTAVLDSNFSDVSVADAAANSVTFPGVHKFRDVYDSQISWSDVSDYIDVIAPMYAGVGVTAAGLKSAVQPVFNSINGGAGISFRTQMPPVIDAIVENLPAFYPTGLSQYGSACSHATASMSKSDTVCSGQPLTLKLILAGSSPWSVTYEQPDGTSKTINNIASSPYTFNVNDTGTYHLVSVFDKNGVGDIVCAPIIKAYSNGATAKWDTSNVSNGCAVGDLKLDLSGSGGWVVYYNDNGGTTQSVNIPANTSSPYTLITNPTIGDVYTLTRVVSGSCDVTMNSSLTVCTPCSKPTVTVTSNSPLCIGSTLNLSTNVTLNGSSTSATYNWSGANNFISTEQNPSLTNANPTFSGTYTVTVTDNLLCNQTASVSVTINPKPIVNASDQSVCAGTSVILSATGGTVYNWNNGVSQGIPFAPTSTTTYTVTVTDENNCSGTDNVVIIVNQCSSNKCLTDADGNNYDIVKIGGQIWMKENLATTKYNDGMPIPLVTDPAAWSILTTPGYCWNLNSITYKNTYGALYNGYAVNTGKLCPTGWHMPDSTEWNILVDNLGGISVASGHLKEAGTTHWQGPNTGADNSSDFTALPGGYREGDDGGFPYLNLGYSAVFWSSTLLNVLDAWCSFLYFNDASVNQIIDDKRSGYSVRCLKDIDSFGNLTISDSSINDKCYNSSTGAIYLSVSGGTKPYKFEWSNGDITQNIIGLKAGAYYVAVYDNCYINMGADTVTITQPPAVIAGAGSNVKICTGESTTLSASGGVKYLWSTGDTSQKILVFPISLITYKVTVSDIIGCIDTAQVDVMVNSLPVVKSNPADTSLCTGQSESLYGSGAATYVWNNRIFDNIPFIPLLGITTYTVTGTDVNNCSNTAQAVITVNLLPTITVSPIDTNICAGQPVTLNSSGNATLYNWNNNIGSGETKTINPTTSTIYIVTGIIGNTCATTAQANVTVTPLPETPVIPEVIICSQNENAILNITNFNPAYNYNWFTSQFGGSSISQSIIYTIYNVSSPDTLFVEADYNGCSTSARGQGIIRMGVAPTAQFTYQPSIISENVKVNFNNLSTSNIPSDNLLYYWWFGQNEGSSTQKNPTYTYIDSGKYLVKLQVYNDDGCNDTKVDTINVTKLLNVWLPTAFSPNGDFNNDYFYVRGPVQSMHIEIFNQWGINVFESNEQVKGWDGKYKGQDQPEGNYLWNLDAETYDGRYFKLQGVVLLYR